MRKKIVIGSIISLILCAVLCVSALKWDIGNYVSIIGSVASLFGIWVAYLQIRSVREITKETQSAVNNKLADLNNHLTMVDMSRIHSIGKDIQTFLLYSKHEVALIRMRDFKAELIQLRQNEHLFNGDQINRLSLSIKDIGIDIVNLNTNYKKKEQLSTDTINEHIEDALTILTEIEGQLKYKKYDTREIQGTS